MTRPLSPVMHIVAPGESGSPPGGNGWFQRLTVEQVLHDGSAPVLRNLIAVPVFGRLLDTRTVRAGKKWTR